jgi:hypothetical protein
MLAERHGVLFSHLFNGSLRLRSAACGNGSAVLERGAVALQALGIEAPTLQALGVEALNDLLKKHRAKPVVVNPLSQTD